MTDTERERIKAICEVANVKDIGELSDGFHTFNGLYEQRMILFAALVKAYKDKAWKSYRHEDGEWCFGGGWFIVGIDTPEGSYTYHYENKYWDMFDCVDLPRGKHWDGHTEADAETRLMSLPKAQLGTNLAEVGANLVSKQDAIDAVRAISDHGDSARANALGMAEHAIEVLPTVQPTIMRSIGELVGYTDEPCPNCGRLRVERYESGLEICEKCNWCEQTKSYWLDRAWIGKSWDFFCKAGDKRRGEADEST